MRPKMNRQSLNLLPVEPDFVHFVKTDILPVVELYIG